jgi:hypothetical protein
MRSAELNLSEITSLKAEGCDYKSLLQDASDDVLIPLQENHTVKNLMDSLLSFDIDNVYGVSVYEEFLYSLVRFADYINPFSSVSLDSEKENVRVIHMYCANPDTVLQIVRSLPECVALNTKDYIQVFLQNSPVSIMIHTGDNDEYLYLKDFDCFQITYYNGSLLASPAFHLCMMNDWEFELKTQCYGYELERYKDILSITNIDDPHYKILRGGATEVEEDLNKYLVWRGEMPDRFLYLARKI